MDTVYVVYKDGEMYRQGGRKTAYLEEKFAKQVVSAESSEIAKRQYMGKYFDWYELSKLKQNELIEKVKATFDIVPFVKA